MQLSKSKINLIKDIYNHKTPADKFLDLIFRNNFFYLQFRQNVFAMKVVEETFRQLQKVWCLWRQEIFVYLDEDFSIILIHAKCLSFIDR